MSVSMLLLASGSGTRLGGAVPKAFVPVAGVPLVLRSCRRLAALCGGSDREIVLASDPAHREHHLEPLLPELRASGCTQVVTGGMTRLESMRRALEASDPDRELVLVHDAARPFFPIEAARRAMERAREVGAALLATPAPDTLKRVDEHGRVVATVDRSGIWRAQTPQVLRRDLLLQALERHDQQGGECTDDVSLFEQAGLPVEAVLGDSFNVKITTPADLSFAEHVAAVLDQDSNP